MDFFLQPIGHMLVVEELQEPEEKTTESGLIIKRVDEVKDYLEGKVIVCGPGAFDKFGNFQKLQVEAGDFVICRRHSGVVVNRGGKQYRLMSEGDILSKFTPVLENYENV